MDLQREQKRVLSLAVAFAMLFSAVGTAAAQPLEEDARSTITMDRQAGQASVMSVKETGTDTGSEDEKGTEEETTPETGDGTGEETGPETGDGTGEETGPETGDGTGEETTPETGDGTGEETIPETGDGTGEETGPETGDGTGEETGPETEEGTEEETGAGTGEEAGPETGEGTEEETEEGTEEETGPETGEENKKETSDSHEHSWSVDWSFDGADHWHECDAEGCPVADNSEKDGYGEHDLDEQGICIICGYDGMSGIALAAEGDIPSYQEAYEAMAALKEDYPEGMTWTNFEPYGSKGEFGDAYTWNGGAIYGAKSAVGCMAFAFILSDAAFGHLPARAVKRGSFTFEDVKVGDILRMEGNSHSVIVLRKSTGGVIVAEGNYNKAVHWGRAMSAAAVEGADFIITRYPQGYVPTDDPEEDNVVHNGTEGSLSWSLTTSGVLTISGSGAILDYTSDQPSPWNGLDVYTVVIEEGVTGIGNYAFAQSKALSVYIPDSVGTIGEHAFEGSGLVEVTIPGTVRTIGANAFHNCENLVSATVPEGVTTIGAEAFRGCTALTYIDFPASVTSVGAGAFMSCKEMVRVRFRPGSSKVTLGDDLFAQCWKLTHVTLPQTADRISAGMFASCPSLRELYIPATVREIGENPFTSSLRSGVIYFGGSEAEWDKMATIQLKASLQSTGTKVVFDAVFNDPFAPDPDAPDDPPFGDDGPCTDHVDADHDGRCDICGETVSADAPGSDGGDAGTGSGGGGKDPGGTGGSTDRPVTNSPSGGSSGRHHDRSSSSDRSDAANSLGGSGNATFSTSIRRGPDGSSIMTKTQMDGTVATVITDTAGKVEIDVRPSDLAIRTAEQSGAAVSLPIPAVQAGREMATAPAITVYTEKDVPVKVAIPVVSPTAGTVAVIINADGQTKVLSNSVLTKDSIVAVLPGGSTIKIVDNSKSFSDVPAGAWFEDAVAFVSARELFYGTTETTFTPGGPMTYAVLLTALARFDGAETDGGAAWSARSLGWAAAHGISAGADPDRRITFEEAMMVLWRYLGSPVPADALSGHGDADLRSDAQKAMVWAAETGISSGFEEGTVDPKGIVDRAHAAQMLMDLAKKDALAPVR